MARTLFEDALATFVKLEDQQGQGLTLLNLGILENCGEKFLPCRRYFGGGFARLSRGH